MARKNNSILIPAIAFAYVAGVMTPTLLERHGNEAEKAPKSHETSQAQSLAIGKFIVEDVIDGDTIKVKDPKAPKGIATIRILGINAPELHPNQGRPVQCYGVEARKEASRLLLHKTVELKTDPKADTEDEHSRFLRMVDTDPGEGVNNFSVHMVEQGFAAAYRGYVTSIRQDLINDEKNARDHNRGMWDACNIPDSAVPTNLGSEVKFPAAR